MRGRWLIWFFWVAVMLLVLTRFASLRDLAAALQQAKWSWLSLAALLHLFYLYVYAVLYKVGFGTVEVECHLGEFFPVYLASNVANALAPSGGAAATALFVTDARQRGQSGMRTTLGVILVTVADMVSLVPFLVAGIAFLAGRHLVKSYEVLGACCFLCFIAVLTAALLLARLSARRLERLLGWIARATNAMMRRLRRRELSPDWSARTAEQAAGAAAAIVASPRRVLLAVLLALVLQVTNLLMLALIFVAFDQPLDLGALVAGYGLGIVFFVVSFVPQGIAFVEGMMAIVFTSLGYPGQKVAAIVLAFRGLNYWLPLVVGLVFVRRLSGRRAEPDEVRQRTAAR